MRKRTAAIASIALLYAAGAGAALPEFHWAWANPKPSAARFQAVAYGAGVYVAAGSDGALYSSPDGSHWTPRSDGFTVGASLVDILYQGGRFVLTGLDAAGATHVSVSHNGLTWTDQILDVPAGKFVDSIAYGNGTWLLVGNVAFTSTDARSWTRHDLAANLVLMQPVSADGVFVATGGSTGLEYSRDGATWQSAAISYPKTEAFSLGQLASNGSSFVFAGVDEEPTCSGNCGIVYTSSDGADWTLHPEAGEPNFADPLFWDGSRYLTISFSGQAFTSPDGLTWSPKPGLSNGPSAFPVTAHAVAIGPGHYVAAAFGALSLTGSADFVTWKSAFAGASGPAPFLLAVDHQNGKFFTTGVAVATEEILESDDGFKWSTVYSATAASGVSMSHVAFGNGVYVVADSAGKVLTSGDGSHWLADATPPADHLGAVVFGNGLFVGSCANDTFLPTCFATVYTSPDGVTWTAQDLSALTNQPVMATAYTGSRFVALAPDFPCCGVITSGTDLVLTSTDGISWSKAPATLPTAVQFMPPTWANGRLVMIGSKDLSQTQYFESSTDGLHWKGGALTHVDGSLLNPNYDGSYYYATGNGAGLYVSSDGLDWSLMVEQPIGVSAWDMLFEGGMVYAVGAGGAIVVGEAGGPAAAAGTVTTKEGAAVQGLLSARDAGGATLHYSLAAIPAHGRVTVTDASTGAYTYTPDSGFAGEDTFAFAVSDGQVVTKALETITVTGSGSSGGGSSGGGALGVLVLAGLAGAAARRRRR